MKANELRIGNLVMDRGNKILQIDWFERSKVCQKMEINKLEVHPLTEDFEYLQPIPLTEEWLLKFGFILIRYPKEGSDVLTTQRELRGTKWFYRSNDKFNIQVECKDYSTVSIGYCVLTKVQFVHQLQNLYFALTGEELTIKN